MFRFAAFDVKSFNQARAASNWLNWGPQIFARALRFKVAWPPVLGIPALPVLELEELLVVGAAVGVVEELLAPGVAVAALELEELLVVGAAVGVVEELLVPGVAVAAEAPVPPVTGTPPPATLLLLTLALKPMLASFSCRPRIICSHCAKSP